MPEPPNPRVEDLERAAALHWQAPDTEPLRPMIVLPQGAGPDPLPAYLAERSWVPRPGPAFVMTADIADLRASTASVRLSPEPDAAFLGLYRYRGQDLPPPAARAGCCSRSRRATPRPARSTSDAASATRTGTTT
jgi:hypothetical protein